MPTAFKIYAVDFDRDGRRDVVDSVPDLIASTANNLSKDGWAAGKTWGYEVVVPATFNFLLADHSQPHEPIRDWERHGITPPDGQPFPRPDDRAFLLVPAGVQGPGFLMLENFRVIMKYNPAEAYALAIGHLADRLRGGGPFRATLAAVRARVVADRAAGTSAVAGAPRLRCRRAGWPAWRQDAHAIRDFQAKIGRVPDGFASAGILDQLRSR